MVEVKLNPRKRDNYAFFDPESRLHLTVMNPGGVIPQVTARVQSAINTGVLILVNKDTTTPVVSKPTPEQKVQQEPIPVAVEEPTKAVEEPAPAPVVEEPVAEPNTEAQIGEPEQVQEEPVVKKGRKSKKEK